MTMTVGRRIAVGFAVPLLLLLLVAASGYVGLQRLSRARSRALSVSLKSSTGSDWADRRSTAGWPRAGFRNRSSLGAMWWRGQKMKSSTGFPRD